MIISSPDIAAAPCVVHLPWVVRAERRTRLGCAINQGQMDNAEYMRLVELFEWLTPENAGWYYIVSTYGWGAMDEIVAYARSAGKTVMYHPLRWWWYDAPDWQAWMREAMGRYARIADWVVCNEAWNECGATIQDIDESYKLAREIRTDARLWYNGILTSTFEQEQAMRLVREGLADGIGVQCHVNLDVNWAVYRPLVEWLSVNRIPWRVTELDECIPDVLPETLIRQAEVYGQAGMMVKEYGGEGITVWGVDDGHSWQAWGYPLPFDEYYQSKPAWKILIGD